MKSTLNICFLSTLLSASNSPALALNCDITRTNAHIYTSVAFFKPFGPIPGQKVVATFSRIPFSLPICPATNDYEAWLDTFTLGIEENISGQNKVYVSGGTVGETHCTAWAGSGVVSLTLYEQATKLPQTITVSWEFGGKRHNGLPIPFGVQPVISGGKPLDVDISKLTKVEANSVRDTLFTLDDGCYESLKQQPDGGFTCNGFGCNQSREGPASPSSWTFGTF